MSGATTNIQNDNEQPASDQIFRLREWGKERIHMLPSAPTSHCSVGAAETCTVRLTDPKVSSTHAHLRRDSRQWFIRALDRDRGLFLDGARCDAFLLEPGVEIGIGGVTLIAESQRSVAMRSFCARILGWGADRTKIVDLALRSIRMAATHRTALWVWGEGDLVPIAHALHRQAFGDDRPFVVCDPRRRDGDESIRCATNYWLGVEAVKAAAGGSLCVRSSRLPRDFSSVLALVRDPGARAQLIVCSGQWDHGAALFAAPIEVPPLTERAKELPRIIDEYAQDASIALNAPVESFTSRDREWIIKHAPMSLPAIEKATLRLVALRASPNLTLAAARLGMAPVSLSRWFERQELSLPAKAPI